MKNFLHTYTRRDSWGVSHVSVASAIVIALVFMVLGFVLQTSATQAQSPFEGTRPPTLPDRIDQQIDEGYQFCSTFTAPQQVPAWEGFSSPFSVYGQVKSLINVLCKPDDNTVRVAINLANNQIAAYYGYITKSGEWQQIEFSPVNGGGYAYEDSQDWLYGDARADVTFSENEIAGTYGFVLAFVCTLVDNVFHCGCEDSQCSAPQWQIQLFPIQALDASGGGSGSGMSSDDNAGGGDTGSGGDADDEESGGDDGSCPVDRNHADYCELCGPCGAGEGDCDNNNECSGNLVCYHHEKNTDGTDFDYCRAPESECPLDINDPAYCDQCGPCAVGEGDCDSDNECAPRLYCYHQEKADDARDLDYCRVTDNVCPVDRNHADYCKLCGPCGSGEGDCDNNSECSAGYVCHMQTAAEDGTDMDYCRPSDSLCPVEPGHDDYCVMCGPCGEGEGDCETDQCAPRSNLRCIEQEGTDYCAIPGSSSSGGTTGGGTYGGDDSDVTET